MSLVPASVAGHVTFLEDTMLNPRGMARRTPLQPRPSCILWCCWSALIACEHCCLQVFYLGYGGLKQVDLSDDIVVAAIASDDWENAMIPVEVSRGWGRG